MIYAYSGKDELPASCSACMFCRHMAWCAARKVSFGRKDDWLYERRAVWCPLDKADGDDVDDQE